MLTISLRLFLGQSNLLISSMLGQGRSVVTCWYSGCYLFFGRYLL